MIDFSLISLSLPDLLHGTVMTLKITGISASLGLFLGSFLGLITKIESKVIRFAVNIYVTVFRGTPMLIQILFAYYALAQLGITIAPFWAASLAIGLNSGAYVSQIICSGINSVPKGQLEAAFSLGFSSIRTLRLIVFPQAFRAALPALGNEVTTLIKDSSLASIIGVVELSKEASIIRSRTYDAFSILIATSMIYLTLTLISSLIIKKQEKRIHSHV